MEDAKGIDPPRGSGMPWTTGDSFMSGQLVANLESLFTGCLPINGSIRSHVDNHNPG
jgi:hypothetical protein